MRLNINLATQPYEDARQFLRQWAGILGALLILAVLLSYAVITRWQHYKVMSTNIGREKQILSDLEAKQRQGLAILNKPENRDVRERSEYLNQLILRKELSWTKIFTDLEKMMPAHLRVLSVQPRVENDQIIVSMQLGGDSRDRAAELVRRMEKSSTFRSAYVTNEVDGPAGQPDAMRFQVTAQYIPASEEATAKTPGSTAAMAQASSGGGQ